MNKLLHSQYPATPYFQLLRVESELWPSDLQKSVGNADFLARSAVPFDDTEMKQMYILRFCELDSQVFLGMVTCAQVQIPGHFLIFFFSSITAPQVERKRSLERG